MENLITEPNTDYELLDSGNGEKLERYGTVVLSRPDPQVLWQKKLPESEWKKAHAVFEHTQSKGKWLKPQSGSPDQNSSSGVGKIIQEIPQPWKVSFSGVTLVLKLSPFKHVGLFPEQSVQWDWLQEKIKEGKKEYGEISVLNLFGYTGGASIVCAVAGASVTHVDASETSVAWAKINRNASGLSDQSIRFIVDDARKFVEREIKRGKKYDIIIMDPPSYGRGVKNELWKIEDDLLPFVSRIGKILSDNPLAIVLNGYAAGYSHVAYKQVLENLVAHMHGTLTSGELMIKESHGGRLLPCGICARWSK